MTSAELDRIALMMHDLGFRGICVESQEYGNSVVQGIHVNTHFFPVTELDDIDNIALLVNGMFADILAKRAAAPKGE
jgi:hypothetical protein